MTRMFEFEMRCSGERAKIAEKLRELAAFVENENSPMILPALSGLYLSIKRIPEDDYGGYDFLP